VQNRTVLFINPDVPGASSSSPPMGALFLAAYVRERFPRYRFQLLDWTADRPSLQAQADILREIKPAIVGVTTFTDYLRPALDLARLVKETLPDCTVIFGGPHVSACPNDAYPNVDCVVAGEGELAFAEMLTLHDRGGEMPPVYFNEHYLEDINFHPAWDLVGDWEKYKPTGFFFGIRQQAWVMASRGCPYNCVFCAGGVFRRSRPRQRFRDPANVMQEIRFHQSLHPTRAIFFVDDEFNTNIDWAKEVCGRLASERIGLPWATSMRTTEKLFDEGLLEVAKKVNCRAVAMGLESGNDEVLKAIKKGTTVEFNLRALRLLKQHRIMAHGNFILGLAWYGPDGKPDGERLEQVMDTLNFIRDVTRKGLLSSVSISIATPYPGSELGKLVDDFKLNYLDDTSHLGVDAVNRQLIVFRHPHLSPEQIQECYQNAWQSVIYNVPMLVKRFLNISRPEELIDNLKLGYFLGKKLLKGKRNLRNIDNLLK